MQNSNPKTNVNFTVPQYKKSCKMNYEKTATLKATQLMKILRKTRKNWFLHNKIKLDAKIKENAVRLQGWI